jgi:hypothetical protein
MLRRRSSRPVEPAAPPSLEQWVATLEPIWQAPVRRAMATRDQYRSVVERIPPGPARERLLGMQPSLDTAVERVAQAAYRASTAQAMTAALDPSGAAAELKAARRELEANRAAGRDVAGLEDRVEALAERHRAVNDALNVAEGAGTQLDDLNVRLETAVARAATIALRASDNDDLDRIARELGDVVGGLAALDDALGRLGP